MNRRMLLAGAGALAIPTLGPVRAQAAISDGVVKIGVLDDMSGVFSDQQGMGDVVPRGNEALPRISDEQAQDGLDELAGIVARHRDQLSGLIARHHRELDDFVARLSTAIGATNG